MRQAQRHWQSSEFSSPLCTRPTAVAQAARLLVVGTLLAAPAAFAQDSGTAQDASLPTVTVTGHSDTGLPAAYAGGQVARGGGLGVLGTQDVLDTPFSTLNYTAEGIKNLQARTVGDVITSEASVRNTNGDGGFGDSYQIRGLPVSVNDTGFNGLYGLVSLSRMSTAMLERVEVLKGPGTLMYGMGPAGGVGGAINLVSKRAGEEPVSSLTATYVGSAQLGLQGDIGRRFGQDKEWGIRVNALYADGRTSVADNRQQQSMGSLALDYTGRKLRWTLDAYTQHEDTRNFRPQFSIGATSMPSAPAGDSNLYPGNTLQIDDKVVATRLEYDLTEQLTAYGAIGYHEGATAQSFPSATITGLDGATSVRNGYYDQKVVSTSADVGLRARFATGPVLHTLSMAANTLDQQTSYFYFVNATGVASNLYQPAPLAPVTAARGEPLPQSQTRLSGLALTDTLSIADGRLLLTGGLRRQQVYSNSFSTRSSSNKIGYSPVLGVVVKPLENLSLYANYTAGLSAGGFAGAQYANAGQAFAPYKTKQYESGVKLDWGRVTTTAAVFQIERANSSTAVVGSQTFATQDGRARVRGLELSAYGQAQRGLRLMASGTFFETRQSHTVGGTNDGKEIGAVPKHNFNLGADWDTPWLQGLALNTRIINTGASWYSDANTVKVPGWTRVDLGARYTSRLGGQTITYRANLENLFDKHYWIMQNSYAGYGAGRTLVLSAQVDF
ncbi:TonB-dependent siderophore receptor [Herbaspirillum seropedicae]|uniref:TonB-dependent receptor n=1 Tax=Herbaspirillum seropedicae TaxID=964 RepID=UPI0011206A6F|nr:TonB-dependent siderophore receptor [Herbaspirillum seropedicae]QDD63166.1 TonB-dependent siderophore receptor [Herbaspirillum seropedicae]